MARDKRSQDAKHGEKTLRLTVVFFTDDLAGQEGQIRPKHAWTNGMVRMNANRAHGITPKDPEPFHSLLDMGATIEQVLVDHGIMLHPSRQSMTRYMAKD